MAHYDSEEDDQPRKICDRRGDLTLVDCQPQVRIKMDQLAALQAQMPGFLFAARPIPSPQSITNAKDAMGNGEAGVWTGSVFNTPPMNLSPQSIFASRQIDTLNHHVNFERFMIRRRYTPWLAGLKTMAVFTDGACASNGLATPKGGCAFSVNDGNGLFSRRLEDKGPTGTAFTPTNNRAELRAVIDFLEGRSWWGEGWTRIVVITDSEYVTKGATVWIRKWASNGWKTAAGKPTANPDLWKELSKLMGQYAEGGCEISFWAIPREWNTRVDTAAKSACMLGTQEKYSRISLLGV
ncbi:unnamed protein product [Clonostachys rhizophaga]|uniref:ribonuclease H n=1 Tax=Clonostachys rhizophaga TaxID=160324 RepID=A0A9N9VIH3_9HYPO|nr:unnamed protein product [Clonostachys rhizophaga]